MTERVKGNEEIGADMPAFMAAYDRAREELARIPGVVGVGFGHKHTAGEFTDDVSIQVYVREKKPDAELPPEQRIPKTFDGYRTDVRVIPRVVPLGVNSAKYDTIRGGTQIEPQGKGAPRNERAIGTLGCIVRKRGDDGRRNVYGLTCAHVLLATGIKYNEPVYHPEDPERDGAGKNTVLLGPINYPAFQEIVHTYVPLGRQSTTDPINTEPVIDDDFYIDCGLVKIEIDSMCCGLTCPNPRLVYDTDVADLFVVTDPSDPPEDPNAMLNGINGVRSIFRDATMVLDKSISVGGAPAGFPRVYKVGATTGKTRGIVRSQLPVEPADPLAPGIPPRYPNVIEIEFASTTTTLLNPVNHIAFGEPGDSGSVVTDEEGNAIGVLYSKEDVPPTAVKFMTYACHIYPVLEKLRVCIPTVNGTTWGNCACDDGSGIASRTYPTPAEEPPDAVVRMVAHAAGAARQAEPTAQRRRVDDVAAAFRATPHGRDLLDAVERLRRELGYLVRNVRPVAVAWSRLRGPAFLAATLNHVRGDAPAIPREIDGVSRDALLERMEEVLSQHGSSALRDALRAHGDTLRAMLADADTIDDCVVRLRALDAAEVAT